MDERWMTFSKKRPSRHFELSDTMRTDKHARDREAYPTPMSQGLPRQHRDLGSDVDRQYALLYLPTTSM
jgi:hypothetical protein